MKALILGASGMVGGILLEKCLASSEITEVVSIARRDSGVTHSKLTEVVHKDFNDFSALQSEFENVTAAYFCIGVYTGSVPDEKFKEITVDYSNAFGDQLKASSPSATVCFLSGGGADPKEKSRMSFAKYKGMAENYLIKQGFGALFIFRPAYIYPVEKRPEPNFTYKISRALYPLIKLMGKGGSIKSTELATAMFEAGLVNNSNNNGSRAVKQILENREILALLAE